MGPLFLLAFSGMGMSCLRCYYSEERDCNCSEVQPGWRKPRGSRAERWNPMPLYERQIKKHLMRDLLCFFILRSKYC